MATIANLDVNLKANTAKFDSGIKKAGTGVKKFGSQSKTSFATVAVAAAGVTAAIALLSKGFGLLRKASAKVFKQFENIDRLAKFADQIGTTVGQLQALELQAALTGSSNEVLGKGISRFNRLLGDAQAGLATGTKAFQDFGMSADQFIGLPLSEQFAKVADHINAGTTAADKSSRAYAIFGRSADKLMTFFAGGGSGIRAAVEDIEKFGAGISRVDSAAVERANDAMTRLKAATAAVWQRIAIDLAPSLEAVVNMVTTAQSVFNGFGISGQEAFGLIALTIAGIVDALDAAVGLTLQLIAVTKLHTAALKRDSLAAVHAGVELAQARMQTERGLSGARSFAVGASLGAAQARSKSAPVVLVLPNKALSNVAAKVGDAVSVGASQFTGGTKPPTGTTGETPTVAALAFGSSASISAILKAERDKKGDPLFKEAVKQTLFQKNQVEEQRKTNRLLQSVGLFALIGI